MKRSGTSAADRIQFQMTLHEEDEENVDEKDQVGNRDPKWVGLEIKAKQNIPFIVNGISEISYLRVSDNRTSSFACQLKWEGSTA